MMWNVPKFDLNLYIDALHLSLEECDAAVEKIVGLMKEAKQNKKRVWVLGNGGSLAIAQHFAQDLVKMRGVRAHAMTCPSMITAYSNDEKFAECFSMPLEKLVDDGDVIMAFSCSGKSRNYQRIFSTSWSIFSKLKKIAVVGTDGGFMNDLADVSVHVKNNNYQICETAFCVVADLVLADLEE